LQAIVNWFDDDRGYGFATTTDGKRVFIHQRNFSGKHKLSNIVQGTVIECELERETPDAFTEALNSGSLRDVVNNHRNPRIDAYKPAKRKSPVAVNIRVMSHF
jgi:cold shock CspA family protein